MSMNIKKLMDLRCYRGLRHHRPVRDQRTHTHARTRKSKAVAIAGKNIEEIILSKGLPNSRAFAKSFAKNL